MAGKNEPHKSLPLLGWKRENLRGRGEFQKLGGEWKEQEGNKRGLYRGRGVGGKT